MPVLNVASVCSAFVSYAKGDHCRSKSLWLCSGQDRRLSFDLNGLEVPLEGCRNVELRSGSRDSLKMSLNRVILVRKLHPINLLESCGLRWGVSGSWAVKHCSQRRLTMTGRANAMRYKLFLSSRICRSRQDRIDEQTSQASRHCSSSKYRSVYQEQSVSPVANASSIRANHGQTSERGCSCLVTALS